MRLRLISLGLLGNKNPLGRKLSADHKKAISLAMRGKKNSLGIKRSIEFKQRLSEYWKDNPDHNLRVDGQGYVRTSERVKDMSRLGYRLWRSKVFERDDWTCQSCGVRGTFLHADHIKPYAKFPELRHDIDNGRTLCVPCHRKTDTYGTLARME